MKLHVLGIRHHGVGSAKNCLAQLKEIQPDYIIVEGPEELMDSFRSVALNTIVPPVSILLYNPKELAQSSFYPFAEFSPEWQTILFAQANNIEYTTADLPKKIHFGLESRDAQDAENQDDDAAKEGKGVNEEIEFVHPEGYELHQHPMEVIAQIEGYSNVDLWWEHQFEQKFVTDASMHFEAVLEVMSALRSTYVNHDFERNELREAFMREAVRKAEKEGRENVVFVCGAWHAPAILEYKSKKKADAAIIKKLPKEKVASSWIPWLNSRLAWKSGYGAGVTAPGWYEHLWKYPKDKGERWLSHVARVFREKKIDVSTAHIIEALRLATALASMRELSRPGLAELDEAVISTIGMGDAILMNYIKDDLTIGQKIGKLPEGLAQLPIQKDFEQKRKRYRFQLREDDKNYQFDLRKSIGLEKSAFLHQLKLLGINWGELASVRSKGTFKEVWILAWKPEITLEVIDKGIWGNTVLLAAQNYVNHQANNSKNVVELTHLINATIVAQLFDSVDFLIKRIQDLASLSSDVMALMGAVVPLIEIFRYSDIRKTDETVLENLIDGLLSKIFISVEVACQGIDDDLANEIFQLITSLNDRIPLLEKDELTNSWINCLSEMREDEQVSSLIRGAVYRIMLDNKNLSQDEVQKGFSKALSIGANPKNSAYWIEGFLRGSAMILILDNTIWNILYVWMQDLPVDNFDDLLPILRRTFSQYAPNERKQLGEKAKKGLGQDGGEEGAVIEDKFFNQERADWALIEAAKLLNLTKTL